MKTIIVSILLLCCNTMALHAETSEGYPNSKVPIEIWANHQYKNLDSELFAFENAVSNANQNVSPAVTRLIREELRKRVDTNVFMALLGYHEIIRPEGTLISEKLADGFRFLDFESRYNYKFEVICAFSEDAKANIVLLPGRGTTISAMFGLEMLDYTNNVAKVYFENLPVNVCVVDIFTLQDIAMGKVALSGRGVSVSTVLDFVQWMRQQNDLPIVLGGVSNGGHVAEAATVVDKRIAGLISAGSAARYDYPLSIYSNSNIRAHTIRFQDPAYIQYNFLFRSPNIYSMFDGRPIFISIGHHDPVNNADRTALREMLETVEVDCVELHEFEGRHRFDPSGEVSRLKPWLNRCIN